MLYIMMLSLTWNKFSVVYPRGVPQLVKALSSVHWSTVLGAYKWLAKFFEKLRTILFADGSSAYYSSKSKYALEETANSELQTLCNWFKVSKLSLNIGKTNYIPSYWEKSKQKQLLNIMDVTEIIRRAHVKFIGIFVDDKLINQTGMNT